MSSRAAAEVLPKFMLPFGKARDRERKKLVMSQQAQKKELEQKHLNALKAFDKELLKLFPNTRQAVSQARRRAN